MTMMMKMMIMRKCFYKTNSGVYSDGPLFIVNEQNAASFAADDGKKKF